MRRPFALLILALSACSPPPQVAFPVGPVPDSPGLLPAESLSPPAASSNPGPALADRAQTLRTTLGL